MAGLMWSDQVRCIMWAQWRSVVNQGWRKGGIARAFTLFFALLWYGIWAFAAWVLASIARDPQMFQEALRSSLPLTLLGISVYWQIIPLLMVSSGLSLDLARLRPYPIPERSLFGIEALLRLSTSVEVLLISTGLGAGLLLNPKLPVWCVSGLILLNVANALLSAGIRDLFSRLLARRTAREILGIVFVLLAVLPQMAIGWASRQTFPTQIKGVAHYTPWSAAARICSGEVSPGDFPVLLASVAVAFWFARRQFDRSLRFDASPSTAAPSTQPDGRASLADRLSRLPERFLPDPLAALIWKEVRFLSRAPRFRLLFLMGFSFGLLIWLPMVSRGTGPEALRSNFLAAVSAYALLLLGDIVFWNQFGLDRSAVQNYFVAPVELTQVFLAKNIAGAFFVTLELALVALVCFAVRMPVTAEQVLEAFAVNAVLTILMMSMGNLLSVRAPRPIDPTKSWRNNAGSTQMWLLFIYPVASLPVLLAYAARYAFEATSAFWAVIALDLLIAGVIYSIALDSAAAYASARREDILTSLSGQENPVTV